MSPEKQVGDLRAVVLYKKCMFFDCQQPDVCERAIAVEESSSDTHSA
jgi:hypothetical protein